MGRHATTHLVADLKVRLGVAGTECLSHAAEPHIIGHVVRDDEAIMLGESAHGKEQIR